MVEGRLEMCVDGVWSIALITQYRIPIQIATVACRQLGFSAKGFSHLLSYFLSCILTACYIQPAEYYYFHHLEMEMVLLCTQKLIVMEMKNQCLIVGCHSGFHISVVFHNLDMYILYPFDAQMVRIELLTACMYNSTCMVSQTALMDQLG